MGRSPQTPEGEERRGEKAIGRREVRRRSQKRAGATTGRRGDALGSRGVEDRRPRAEVDGTPGDPGPAPPVSALR